MKGFSNKEIRDIQSFNIQNFADVRSMSYSRWSLQFYKKSLEVFLKGQGAQYCILQYTIKRKWYEAVSIQHETTRHCYFAQDNCAGKQQLATKSSVKIAENESE